ncbi:NaeI family type II restriction endonuclease [Streptomyces sp. NPDC048603]|uniref:NaeI family type II restriction endonuclease n=1 Tax=Streptomyces sp. NPDC048603 TaxID=3365577 RepID=UPI003724BCD6
MSEWPRGPEQLVGPLGPEQHLRPEQPPALELPERPEEPWRFRPPEGSEMPEGLARVLGALRTAAPDLDGTALAEVLWLAARMAADRDPAGPGPARPRPDPAGAEPPVPPAGRTADGSGAPTAPPGPTGPRPAPVGGPAAPGTDRDGGDGTRSLHERRATGADALRGTPVAAPRAPALPHALELTRALRPWKRRWREGRLSALDVDRTVADYARSGELVPVFTPAPERWFDVTFVVDRSPGMRVWSGTVEEFATVVARLGAFRTLRVRDLSFRPDGSPVAPGPAGSPDGRMLVVVVSDCSADAWRRPGVWRLLHAWAGTTPTALLNPLPTRLWRGTGLDLPLVRVTPTVPGPYGAQLPHENPPLLDRDTAGGPSHWQPVPVLSLSAHSLGRWSRALMRNDPAGCSAVLVPPTGRLPARSGPAARPVPPQVRAHGFLRTASRPAVRLAVLCSAFDRLGLPVLQLIREALVPEAATADVAEVVTSGLFELADEGGSVTLSLGADAQSVLRERLTTEDVWHLHDSLDRHVAERAGTTGLASVLPDAAAAGELPVELRPFARASRQTLELLGVAAPERTTPPPEPGPYDLPPAPDPFVGSEELVHTLVNALGADLGGPRRWCLTAEGAEPGVGRTALALHVSHRVRDSFSDGQVFLDLRGSTPHPVDTDAALSMLLTALGRPAEGGPQSTGELLTAAVDALREQRVLVVLDDAHDTGFLGRLCAGAPDCAWLVTVRNPEHVPSGFATAHLLPLSGEDAVAVVAATAGPRLDPRDRSLMLAFLGGNGKWYPLEARLCGAWLAEDPSCAVEEDLIRVLLHADVAGGRSRSDFSFHGLMERVLPAELLDAAACMAVAGTGRLMVHEARSLLGVTADRARRTMEQLADAGVLERRSQDGYRFHTALHAAFLRVCEAGWRQRIDGGLAAFHRSAAVLLHDASRPASHLAHLLGERDPDLTPEETESLLGPPSDTWISNALASVIDAGDRMRDRQAREDLVVLLFLLRDTGGPARHRHAFERAADILIRSGDQGFARLALAWADHACGRIRDAAERLEPLLPDAELSPWHLLSSHVLLLAGTLAVEQGEPARARGYLQEAAHGFTVQSDPYALASAHLGLARAELRLGRTPEALERAEEVLEEDFDPVRVPLAREALRFVAVAASAAGRHDRALEVLTELRRAHESLGDERAVGEVLVDTVDACLQLGRRLEALAASEEAVLRFQDPGLEWEQADALELQAAVLLRHADDVYTALRVLERAGYLMDGRDPERVGRLRATARALFGMRTLIGFEMAAGPAGEEEVQRLSEHLARVAEQVIRHLSTAQNCLVGSELIAGGCVLVCDASIGTADLVNGLAEQLPRALTASGFPYAVHMAVTVTEFSGTRPHGVELLLHAHEVRSLARRSSTWPVVHMSAKAHAVMAASPSAERVYVDATPTGADAGSRLLVPAEATWPLSDPGMHKLAMACNAADPDGDRLARLLRDSIDADAAQAGSTGNLKWRNRAARSRLALAVEHGLRSWGPFGPGGSTDLILLARDLHDKAVGFDVKLSLSQQWDFPRSALGRLVMLVHVDDRVSRWSVGLLRLQAEHMVQGDRPRLSARTLRNEVLWLHRHKPLPPAFRLHVSYADQLRTVRGSSLDRLVELFTRFEGRGVPPSVLIELAGENWQRRLREAAPVLRERGILLLGPSAADRVFAHALGLYDGSPADYYTGVRLTRYEPSRHGDRQSIRYHDNSHWIRAGDRDPVEPLPDLRSGRAL